MGSIRGPAAIASGEVAGAGLDVFLKEPPGENALFQLESVVATPHIAGSTEEAQEIVGIRIVEQMVEYLKGGAALNAVNMPPMTADQYRTLKPYIVLAERLGQFLSHVTVGNAHTIRLVYFGRLAEQNTQVLRNAALAGVLNRSLEYRANVVNAMQIATQRGTSLDRLMAQIFGDAAKEDPSSVLRVFVLAHYREYFGLMTSVVSFTAVAGEGPPYSMAEKR